MVLGERGGDRQMDGQMARLIDFTSKKAKWNYYTPNLQYGIQSHMRVFLYYRMGGGVVRKIFQHLTKRITIPTDIC